MHKLFINNTIIGTSLEASQPDVSSLTQDDNYGVAVEFLTYEEALKVIKS